MVIATLIDIHSDFIFSTILYHIMVRKYRAFCYQSPLQFDSPPLHPPPYLPPSPLISNFKFHVQIAHQPSIYVLDTPGVLVPSIPDIETGLKLALSGKSFPLDLSQEKIFLMLYMTVHQFETMVLGFNSVRESQMFKLPDFVNIKLSFEIGFLFCLLVQYI